MFRYEFANSNVDDYSLHQILKRMFPGDGKLLFKQTENCIICYTNIELQQEILFIEDKSELKFHDLKKVSFNLSLNPVKNLYGKKIAFKTSNEIRDYVIKKLENIGISFNDSDVKILRHYVKKCIRKENELKFNAVDVYVECDIKDINKFKNALENGVGSCKMCGFGLIDMQTVQ